MVLNVSVRNPNNPISEADRKALHEAVQLSADCFANLTDNQRLRFLSSYIVTYAMNSSDPGSAFLRVCIAAAECLERAMQQERERGGTA